MSSEYTSTLADRYHREEGYNGAPGQRFGPSLETTISTVNPDSVDIEMQPQTNHDILVQSDISRHDSTGIQAIVSHY